MSLFLFFTFSLHCLFFTVIIVYCEVAISFGCCDTQMSPFFGTYKEILILKPDTSVRVNLSTFVGCLHNLHPCFWQQTGYFNTKYDLF